MQENSPKQIQNVAPRASSKDQSLDTIANSLVQAYGKKGDTFSEMQSEIVQLENDLKYVTGAKNKAEILDRIMILKNRLSKTDEAKIIEKENEDNFESGMSFTSAQKKLINALVEALSNKRFQEQLRDVGVNVIDITEDIKVSDLAVKESVDGFVKQYRNKRNNFPNSYPSIYTQLDEAVLGYEKAFGIKSAPLIDESLKNERARRENIREIKSKLDELKGLQEQLLRSKANAKVNLFGRKDTSGYANLENDIRNARSAIATYLVSVMSDSGVDLNVSDFQIN